MKVSRIFLLSFLFVTQAAGCGELRPSSTSIKAGPFSIQDSKDNDVQLKGSYNPDTGMIIVDNFSMRNNASDPNKTLPPIIIGNAEYRRAVNEGVIGETNAIFGGVSNLMTAATPLLTARMQAKLQQSQLDALQPSVVQEVISGIAGGKLSLPGVAPFLSPAEVQQVIAQLAAIQAQLEALRKATAPPVVPTSNPVVPPVIR